MGVGYTVIKPIQDRLPIIEELYQPAIKNPYGEKARRYFAVHRKEKANQRPCGAVTTGFLQINDLADGIGSVPS